MQPLCTDANLERFEAWLLGQRNDLSKVARDDQIAPVIGDVLDALNKHAVVSEMSGSGSTCWGWFRSARAAEIAAEALRLTSPAWWVQAVRMTGSS
jgi:4-diphosphocytidyl-2-C-methyl-D-erythritol kinase